MSNAEQFVCANCSAKYRIVRTEGPSVSDREVTCLSCGAPFQAHEGKFVLKYFRIERPKRVSGRSKALTISVWPPHLTTRGRRLMIVAPGQRLIAASHTASANM